MKKQNFPTPPTSPITDPAAQRHYGPAALAAAYAAWQAGNDVYAVLSQAGYAYNVAQGLAEYYNSRFAEPPVDYDLTQEESQMSTSSTSGARVKRRRGSYGAIAPVSKGVKRYVKGCMNRLLEIKTYNQAPSGNITPGTGGTMTGGLCNAITQGDGDNQREGNVIHIKKLSFLFTAFDTVPSLVRVIVFIDRQSNGSTPTVTDVLDSASYLSQFSELTVVGHGGTRFSILMDKTWTINPQITATAGYGAHITKTFKLKMPVTYIANAGTAGDVSKNNIWLLSISSTTTGVYQYSSSLVYTDN